MLVFEYETMRKWGEFGFFFRENYLGSDSSFDKIEKFRPLWSFNAFGTCGSKISFSLNGLMCTTFKTSSLVVSTRNCTNFGDFDFKICDIAPMASKSIVVSKLLFY